MGKDIVVAMSAVFLLWVGAIFVRSTRLVTANWWMFRTWRRQPRKRRVKMALWLGIPILMAGLLWMRGIAIWHYAEVYGIPMISLIQMMVYLPAILISLALILWWACDVAYNGDDDIEDADRIRTERMADRAWMHLMLAGLVLAMATLAATWWL